MIYLDSTSKKLELVLAGAVAANALEVSLHYFKITPQATTTERRGGVQRATSNNTTDVTIADAPELQGIIKNIHTMFVHNKDTATATVTIKIDDSGTETILVKQAIAAGESLTYEDQRGWEILSPITPPFIDTTPIVRGSVDSTKLLRIEVDGLTSGVTRTWTAADADIMPCGHASGLTNTRVPYATGATGGVLTDSANLVFDGTKLTANQIGAFTLAGTIAGGGNQLNNIVIGTSTPLAGSFTTLTATGAVSLSPANLNVTASPTGTGTVTINPATLGNIDNTRIGFSTRAAIQATTGDFTGSGGSYLLALNATTGTRYSWIDFQNTAVSKAQVYWDNTNTDLNLYTASGNINIRPAGTASGVWASTGLSITGTLSATGHTTFEGVTSTGATGTGKFVFDASPTFTSVPAAPTAAVGTNTTQLATTAFVSAFPQQITASLGADTTLNNASNYFDGPSVAQGTSGTWFATGTVTVQAGSAASNFSAKLWDGTTVIASCVVSQGTVSGRATITLSGYLASPAGNIRISVKDVSTTDSKILYNNSGNSKDSTITAFKVAN